MTQPLRASNRPGALAASACADFAANPSRRALLDSVVGVAIALGSGWRGAQAARGPQRGDWPVDADDAELKPIKTADIVPGATASCFGKRRRRPACTACRAAT